MVLRLRLARIRTPGGSKKHAPIYNIVLAQARSARDSRPMEVLGTYDPIPKTPIGAEPGQKKVKDIKVDVARAKYWLGVGAQPSDTVWRLLSMIGLLEPRYLPTGQQNEQALKAVRFPTQTPRPETPNPGQQPMARISNLSSREHEASQPAGGVTGRQTIYDNHTKGKTDIGAENTSPMNPNQA